MLSNTIFKMIQPRLREILAEHDTRMDLWLNDTLQPTVTTIFDKQLGEYKDKITNATTEIVGKYETDNNERFNRLEEEVTRMVNLLSEINSKLDRVDRESTASRDEIAALLVDFGCDMSGLADASKKVGVVLKAMGSV